MLRVALVVAIIGVLIIGYGYNEMLLSGVAKESPQTISCYDLARNGYGDNAHVTITNFDMHPAGYMYNTKGSRWVDATAPIVPYHEGYEDFLYLDMLGFVAVDEQAQEAYAKRTDISEEERLGAYDWSSTSFKVALKFTGIVSESRVENVIANPEVTGLVINEIDGLSSGEASFMKKQYPNINPRDVLLIEIGRKPSGSGTYLGAMLLGVLVIGAAIVMFVAGQNAKKRQDEADAMSRRRRGRGGDRGGRSGRPGGTRRLSGTRTVGPPPAAAPGYPPQPGYPPHQPGYPPHQPGYPPQQHGYPQPHYPQQPGYPPQAGYPQQPPPQHGYPPQQPPPGYPPQQRPCRR